MSGRVERLRQRWWWHLRVGRRYVGRCTRTHHLTVLTSGKGTYCAWHRWRNRKWLKAIRDYSGKDA